MKKLFTILAVAATLVSCAKEDVVSQAAPEAIGFDNTFIDNATRSVYDPSYTNGKLFNDFQVYGFVQGQPLFNADNKGVTVYKNGGSLTETDYAGQEKTDWKYAGTQYWIPGADYNFSAVAPATGWTKTEATAERTKLSFTNDAKHDILYAQTATIEGKQSGNVAVGFTFRHILSKVKFSFLNNYNADNTVLQVRDITVRNAVHEASVELTAENTTWSGWIGEISALKFGNAAEDSADAVESFGYKAEVESYNELLLIPYNYGANTHEKLSVSFVYDIVVSGEVVATFKVEPKVVVNLEPGKAYDFKATITPGEPIEFTVTTITDWDNDHDGKENTADGDTDGDEQVETTIPQNN
jgi:hypothetical protein